MTKTMFNTAYLKVWKVLDENSNSVDELCISSICVKCNTSQTGVKNGINILKDLGLVNTKIIGRSTDISLTPKFFSTRKVFQDIYEVMVKDANNN